MTLKAFQGLQRVVMQKAEDVTVDNIRIQVDALKHRADNMDNSKEKHDKEILHNHERIC